MIQSVTHSPYVTRVKQHPAKNFSSMKKGCHTRHAVTDDPKRSSLINTRDLFPCILCQGMRGKPSHPSHSLLSDRELPKIKNREILSPSRDIKGAISR